MRSDRWHFPPCAGTVDQFVTRLHDLTEGGHQTVGQGNDDSMLLILSQYDDDTPYNYVQVGQQALLSAVRDIVARMDFTKIPA